MVHCRMIYCRLIYLILLSPAGTGYDKKEKQSGPEHCVLSKFHYEAS